MSRHFAVRLTYPATQIPQAFWSKLSTQCDGLFAVEHHDTENPHIHMAIKNARVSQDTFRKKLVLWVKEFIEDEPAKGNALLCVKQWKGMAERYIVYMLKGYIQDVTKDVKEPRYQIHWNSMTYTDAEIKAFRDAWTAGESAASTEYKAFKASEWYPQCVIILRTEVEMLASTDGGWLQKKHEPPFDTIVENAKEFSMIYLKREVQDGTTKYLAKNLISNYCHFNKIKMKPYYI